MLRGLFISFLFIGSFIVRSQNDVADQYLQNDTIIDATMKAEQYEEAVTLIEKQLELIEKHQLHDSLYHYCYNYGRALWKTKGQKTGLGKAVEISDQVKRADPDVLHYLQTLNDLSWLYYETGNVKECLVNDSLYLAICLANEGIPIDLMSIAYYNLGFDYMEFGKYAKSLEQFQKSIDVILDGDDSLDDRLSMSYNALGAMQWRLGDFEGAKKSYEESLLLLSGFNDPKSQLEKGNILGNIALILQDNGEIIKAKEMQEEFIRIDRQAIPLIEDPYLVETALRRISTAYINLADIYFSLGDFSKSRQLVELAIEERTKLLEPDDPSLASAIEHLAFLEMQSGNYQVAENSLLDYLDYCRKYFGAESGNTAQALKDLGTLYIKMGDAEKSANYFTRAIANQKAVGNPATDPALGLIYRERSAMYVLMNEPGKALADLERSMGIYSKTREKDNRVFVGIYLEMAEIELNSNDLKEAREYVSEALNLLEERKELAYQTPYLLPNAYYLKALIETKSDADQLILIQAMNDLEMAVGHLKTNKQLFLDEESKLMLYHAHKKIFELAEDISYQLYENSGDDKWIETFFRLTEENRTILLRNKLQNFSALDFAGIPDSILKLERVLTTKLRNEENDSQVIKEMAKVEKQYQELLQHIKNNYPEYYDLKFNDKTFEISEVKNSLLDQDKSLLVYSLTTDHVYTILISQSHTKIFRSPKESLVNDIALLNKALVEGNGDLVSSISESLSELLVKPVKPFLKNTELLIVPDEELFFLNFEILPNPTVSKSIETPKMLIHDYVISYYLSTTVSMQFKGLKDKDSNKLLTFAPGFTDRQKLDYRKLVKDTTKFDGKYMTYIQQPFAVQTAQHIAGLFSGTAFVEELADETTFKEESGKYGIIHLGTHAEINENSPLMSHLVLSKNVTNDSLDDGYLHAYEIYQMPLRAELAVLTACETGIGKHQSSEGVMSLAHSFSYAGCPSIVMSLWNIDEKTSATIISKFYNYLSEGVTKNRALRQAKLDYLADASYELRSPYYWAGLVLLGDVAPVNIEAEFNWKSYVFALLIVLLIVILLVFRRKKQ